MHRYMMIIFILFGSLPLKAQHGSHEGDDEFHRCFLPERSWSVASGFAYSLPEQAAGINARLYYNLGHRLCFGPELSYLSRPHLSITEINFVGHYIFETPLTGIYPLLGGNYTHEIHHGHAEEAFGVVLGGGLHRNFNRWTVFGEYAHVQGAIPDDFITIGFMFTFL